MTRFYKKSVGITAIMTLIVLMVIGVNDVFGDNEAYTLIHEFGEILYGVEFKILAIPDDIEPTADTTDMMHTRKILSQIAYIEAFDEVIQKQILKYFSS